MSVNGVMFPRTVMKGSFSLQVTEQAQGALEMEVQCALMILALKSCALIWIWTSRPSVRSISVRYITPTKVSGLPQASHSLSDHLTNNS
jgi:hypothetical protein